MPIFTHLKRAKNVVLMISGSCFNLVSRACGPLPWQADILHKVLCHKERRCDWLNSCADPVTLSEMKFWWRLTESCVEFRYITAQVPIETRPIHVADTRIISLVQYILFFTLQIELCRRFVTWMRTAWADFIRKLSQSIMSRSSSSQTQALWCCPLGSLFLKKLDRFMKYQANQGNISSQN